MSTVQRGGRKGRLCDGGKRLLARGAGKSKSWHEGKESEGKRGSKCIPRAQSWGGHIHDQEVKPKPLQRRNTPPPRGPQRHWPHTCPTSWARAAGTLRWHLLLGCVPRCDCSSECHLLPRPLARLGRAPSHYQPPAAGGACRTSVQKGVRGPMQLAEVTEARRWRSWCLRWCWAVGKRNAEIAQNLPTPGPSGLRAVPTLWGGSSGQRHCSAPVPDHHGTACRDTKQTVPGTWSEDQQDTQNLGSHRNPSVRTVMAGLVGTRRDSALGRLFHDQPWGSSECRQLSAMLLPHRAPPPGGGKQGHSASSPVATASGRQGQGSRAEKPWRRRGSCFGQRAPD